MTATATAPDDHGAYLRGKLRLAAVDDTTPIGQWCDVLTVLLVDGIPGDLDKFRRALDRVAWKVRPPDRATWGLRPDQIAGLQRLTGDAPIPGVGVDIGPPPTRG